MIKMTKEQIEKIVIDTGVVYANYGLVNERLLAPCRGDNVFTVDQEIKEIEVNGLKGKTKGLRRKVTENATLKVNLMDLSLSNLQMALPGSKLLENKLSNGWTLLTTDYLDNIVLIGKNMDDKYVKITIYNALMDEPVTLAMSDKEETVIELTLSAHYDLADLEDKLWDIEELDTLVPVIPGE